jgi:hypothetical protein
MYLVHMLDHHFKLFSSRHNQYKFHLQYGVLVYQYKYPKCMTFCQGLNVYDLDKLHMLQLVKPCTIQ